jgi:glutathione S-transferase
LSRINSPQNVCDTPGAEESVRRIAADILFEKFKIADDMLAGREFFFDHFTAPDAHFFWCYRRATQFKLDMAQFKHCTLHFDRMKQRPSVRKVLAYEKDVQAKFAKVA